MRILITAIESEMSMNLLRYFKRLGHIVFGVSKEEYGYSAGSLMVNGYGRIQSPDDPEYLDSIRQIIVNQRIDLFIPVDDLEMYVVIKSGKNLGCKVFLPDLPTFGLFMDKYTCNKRMKELGLSVPEMLAGDNSTIRRIVRPKLSIDSGLDISGIRRDKNAADGKSGVSVGSWGSVSSSLYDKGVGIGFYDSNRFFVQSFVDGDSYTVDILCDANGKPLYIVPRKRIEAYGGIATKYLIENNEKLIEIVSKILRKYKIPGFSNMRFVMDSEGTFWFIEGKCRFSSGGGATLATCVNYLQSFMRIMVDDTQSVKLNEDVGWNKVVTRYFEEMVFDAKS